MARARTFNVLTSICSAAAISAVVLMSPVASAADSDAVTGLWRSVDEKTGKSRSLVRISESNGVVSGKIEKLFREPTEDQTPVCKLCTDDRKDKPVIGMTIISGLKKDGEEWAGGQILDPGNGKTYRAKIWLTDGKLNVRGSIGPFGRTQVWVREGK